MPEEPAGSGLREEALPDEPRVVPADVSFDGVVGDSGASPSDTASAEDGDVPSTLETLHTVTRTLVEAEDRGAVAERAVAAARDVLDLRLSGVHLETDGRLEPVAVTETVAELYGDVPPLEPGESPAWRAYEQEEPIVVGDHEEYESVALPEVPPDTGVLAPLPGHGVFLMNTQADRELTDDELSLALTLASNTRAALDRAHRETVLQRQNERLETFAAMLSHDLRNPLTMLQGNLELARETGEPEYFENADEATERMDELIDQVLVLARSGEAIEERRWVDVDTAARQAWSECETGAADLSVDVPPGLRIHADPDRLRQLLSNLLRNAIEHAEPEAIGAGDGAATAPADAVSPSTAEGAAAEPGDAGPTILVTVGVEDDVLYVADDGEGIPPDAREQVFEYGYTTADGGSGLGLRIVAELAAAHDWTPRVTESEAGGARIELRGVETRDISGEA